jgi:SAM-dependent methyltransferase
MPSIRETWLNLNAQTIGTPAYWSIALQNALHHRDLSDLVRRYARGRILDLGAGKLAWRTELRDHASAYVSGDLTIEHPDLNVVFDATEPYPFADSTFDTIFCCSVLEHCTEPWRAFAEMSRVLQPTGAIILSVPFCFYAHGEPFDFYRFTSHAICYLAAGANLQVVELHANGNLSDQILNVASIVMSTFLSLVGLAPLIAPATRGWLAVSDGMRSLDKQAIFAMNYLAILTKLSQPVASNQVDPAI